MGCHYFPPGPQLPSRPLRGLLPISLLGEQRRNGCDCEQFAFRSVEAYGALLSSISFKEFDIHVDFGTLTDRTELLADDSVYSGRGGNPKNFLSALRKDKWEFQVSTPPIRVASPLVLGRWQ